MNNKMEATCSICGKVRTDEPDYNPLKYVAGVELGWYSGSDGEICPGDIKKFLYQ